MHLQKIILLFWITNIYLFLHNSELIFIFLKVDFSCTQVQVFYG